MTLSSRAEADGDEAFLRRLITQTIIEELGADSWPEPMRTRLVGIQVAARRRHVADGFPGIESRILLAGGVEGGWLSVAFADDVVWLVEIMVLPEYRGKGLGRMAVISVIEAASRRPVRLKVNVTNARAIRLYESLGFRRIDGDEAQHVMEHAPTL